MRVHLVKLGIPGWAARYKRDAAGTRYWWLDLCYWRVCAIAVVMAC